MGGAFIKPFSNPTPGETKQILNTILREMFRRADLIDMYSLADPERCKRYVVVAESALKDLFVQIQLDPRAGPEGTIYFQKIEGIQKANPLGAKQADYCKMLAFYFIRIFQTYAALALSIMDSDVPQIDPQELVRGTGIPVQALAPPAFQGFPQPAPPAHRGWFGMGGALSGGTSEFKSFYLTPELVGPYKILNQYLVRPTEGVTSRQDMRFQDYSSMLIPQGELYRFDANNTSTRQVRETLQEVGRGPVIVYSFKQNEYMNTYITLSGKLGIIKSSEGGGREFIQVTLTDIRAPTDTASKGTTMLGKLFYTSPGSETLTTEKGKHLPALLDELFKGAYAKLTPSRFNSLEFLLKRGIVRGNIESDAVAIEGTKAVIPNPKDNLMRGTGSIPIIYVDRIKLDAAAVGGTGETSKKIKIETTMEIDKEAHLVGEPYRYQVTIQLEGMRVTPSDLYAELHLEKKYRYSIFSTGASDTNTATNEKGQTIPAYVQAIFEDILKGGGGDGERAGGIVFKKGIPQPYNSERVDPAFKVKSLWQALAKDPPVKAHCVARAVQLLSAAALQKEFHGTEAYSQVCRLKFPYIQNDSLPEPGRSITTEAGIMSVAMLFVDQIVGKMPQISSTPKYAEFRRKMKTFFERYETVEGVEVPPALENIEEKLMPFCRGKTQYKIRVEGETLYALRSKAKQLLDRQAIHVRNVMSILFKMFNRSKLNAGVLEFDAKFLSGGMRTINQVAEEARELLIEYYGDCEQTYKDGLYVLHKKGLKETDFVRVDTAGAAPKLA